MAMLGTQAKQKRLCQDKTDIPTADKDADLIAIN
jgi:hypothetical protein